VSEAGAEARAAMVRTQLRARGIEDPRVLEAIAALPRELFLSADLADRAYDDRALPIAGGQTISQPWVVAAICQALELRGGERVLEVGTGSGYSTALLARLAGPGGGVISIERIAELADGARERLAALGLTNVEVRLADGSLGAPGDAAGAGFDAIAVHAATPLPRALLGQLAPGGRLVAPVVRGHDEDLRVVQRPSGPQPDPDPASWPSRSLAAVRFVPLIGVEGLEPGDPGDPEKA
jgi:protein-L-isoaspartate(D-aspartate) O-methyltransferase